FPKYIREGITLSSDDVNIQLMPNGKDNATKYATNHISVRNVDNKTVSYQYGTNTTLEYELTYTGFKEDIVVSEYTGQTEYEFTIYTNGLYLSEEDGSYYLVDDEGTVQATIGDIIIFTADEANNTMGSMTSVTIEDGQEYLLTIHVDGEYLRDEKTVYPIRIDPTIEVNYDNNGAGAIEDVTLNENSGSSGTSGSLYIGKRSTYGKSRTLMKFPTLNLSSVYSESYITSATVEIRDLLCQSTAMTVQCYVFNGNTWSESSANWSNVSPGSYTTLLSSNSISYANGAKQSIAHRYKFDITAAVKGWKSETYTQAKGIMFKAADSVENGSTYLYKTFGSYNRASYKPSLTVNYNVKPSDVTLSMSGNYVMVGQEKTISVTKYPSNLSIMWQSTDRTVATISGNVITGLKKGTTTVVATYRDASTGSYKTQKLTVAVVDDIGIENNTVYNIMNYSSSRYMAMEEASEQNTINVCTCDRSGSDLARWKLELQSDGKYQLINQYDASNKVLDITGTNVDTYPDNDMYYEKFDIVRVDSGVYKGYYLIRYGEYYVVEDVSYNVILSKTVNEKSFWSLMSVEKNDATLCTFNIDKNVTNSINTSADNFIIKESICRLGYNGGALLNTDAGTAYEYLTGNTSLFFFNGHGAEGMICFNKKDGASNGEIAVNDDVVNVADWPTGGDVCTIDKIPTNGLSGLRCVLYIGCLTGVDKEINGKSYNLLQATYEKGAHFVLGTTMVVYTSHSTDFLLGFVEEICQGG
ncbi:MAG: RICIN domain-containing protein, partial [Lachnospiraceae bacterium]|nr:RICIN domain-containing protein [Lachnospiraceae bacterium]